MPAVDLCNNIDQFYKKKKTKTKKHLSLHYTGNNH